jgi:hypothetical protein
MHETDALSRFADRPLEDAGPDFVVERRWLPGASGELTAPIPCTNVAHQVVDLAPRGFDWGDPGPGAHDFALNILEAALRRLGHRGPRGVRTEGACFVLALLLRDGFVTEFVATLPEEGGRIGAADVDRWISGRLHGLDGAQRALLAPRYAWEDGAGGEHWSAAELREITGEPLREAPDGLYTAQGRRIARILDPHPLDGADWESCPV